jgi:hypothetical protein
MNMKCDNKKNMNHKIKTNTNMITNTQINTVADRKIIIKLQIQKTFNNKFSVSQTKNKV